MTGVAAEREQAIRDFLYNAGWETAERRPLAGDASTRRYERLSRPGPRGTERAILMDAPRRPDGPPVFDGLPYSALAHLAEDVRPFVAIGNALRAAGLSAPELFAADLDRGLLLIEDLGDAGYGPAIDAGQGPRGETLDELYAASIDVLARLHPAPAPARLPLPDGSVHEVPPYSERALGIETDLLIDWYLPAATGKPLDETARAEYRAIWASIFANYANAREALAIRDYHSPNLIWLADRNGPERVGVIDFQDAVIGSRAYDVVSLLQDARRDVPESREERMLDYYVTSASAVPNFDEKAFRAAYAALGAQRNAKILGIFVRLDRRDGKPHYLQHLPRVARYFERDLANPALDDLRLWLNEILPPARRHSLDFL